MFKIVKKILGIIGAFKFANTTCEEDKDVIAGCVIYLLSIAGLTALIFILGLVFYI